MKYNFLFIILLISSSICLSQEMDLILNSSESGIKTHQARNSIKFANNYSYTPNGGTLSAEIVDPVVAGSVSYSSFINPETRNLNTTYMVGATNGAFDINAIGAAIYSIPIECPSGPGGFTPSLSLTYSSMNGPGNAGYGWNIVGLSSVSRVPQTIFHDDKSVGVTLSSSDRFALDGQRLICVSGNYGENMSEYRTEQDIITRVRCYVVGSSPRWFIANSKSGVEYRYGYGSHGNSDQTIEGQSEEASWLVDRMKDVYGNIIEYQYIKDSGYNYIANIGYGPNKIKFYYRERSDVTESYFIGSKLAQRLILEHIDVEYNNSLIKRYEFKYNLKSTFYQTHSFLNEIIEYGVNNSRLNSTAFSYETPDNVSFSQAIYYTSSTNISYGSKLTMGDFNGDGLTDILAVDNPDISGSFEGWKYYRNLGNNYFTLSSSGQFLGSSGYDAKAHYIPTDLNGDNMTDLIIFWDGGERITTNYDRERIYYYRYAISNGNSFNSSQYFHKEYFKQFNYSGYVYDDEFLSYKQSDFDGDKLQDIIIMSSYGWNIYGYTYINGSLSSQLTLKYSGTFNNFGDQQEITDFDGDGVNELMAINTNGYKVYKLINGSLVETYSSSSVTTNHYFKFGDFNGDGKTDIFLYGYKTYDWSSWQIRLSTGTGFSTQNVEGNKTNLKNDVVRVGDFNGDGRSDLMVMAKNNAWSGHYYYISRDGGTSLYSHFYSGAQVSTHNYYINDYDGDGRDDYLCTDGESAWWNGYMIYKSGTKNNYVLDKIQNGLGQNTSISYKRLSEQGSGYTKGSGGTFPVINYQGPISVVNSVVTDNGLGGNTTINYNYKGAKVHLHGKGFLCYEQQTVTNSADNSSTENNFNYHSGLFFTWPASTNIKSGTTTLSTTSNIGTYFNTTSNNDVIFPYISNSIITDNLTGHTITTESDYNSYGSPTETTMVYDNGVTQQVSHQYNNEDVSSWYLGRPTSTTISYSKSGETTVSKTINRTYNSNGIFKPDLEKVYEGTNFYYSKNYDYDAFGNLSLLTETGAGVPTRTTSFEYQANGIRVGKVKPSSGHETTNTYDAYGRLMAEEDYLGNITSYAYDNLGRLTNQTSADGSISTTSYNWGLTGGPAIGCYYILNSGNDGSHSKIWFDRLTREIRSDVKAFDGSQIYTVKEYNAKGQVYRTSDPSSISTPSRWTVYGYNTNGQLTSISRPSGRNTILSYSDNKVTETTAGQTSWKTKDSQGLTSAAHDGGGNIIYAYYPDGKIKSVTAPGGIVTSMEYDLARNQTKLIDPSAGTIEYTYNAYGELMTLKNAKNKTTSYNYNDDGRINTVVAPEGTTSYIYNSNKQLATINSPYGISCDYFYDTKGRITSVSETIPGSASFTAGYSYDNIGRISTQTHPSGIIETNHYNTNGYLASISTGGVTRWAVTGMNERQQITKSTYGSGLIASFGFDTHGYPEYTQAEANFVDLMDYRYSFDPVKGNLVSRENYLKSLSETFTYDDLDRLTNITGSSNLTMDYNANGNIITKSDIGTDAFFYNHATKPYALTHLSYEGSLIPTEEQTITYTSFEQPDTISQGSYTALMLYNNDDQRCKMTINQSSNPILSRWYAGGSYIKETIGSTIKEYTFIGGDAYTAPVVAVKEGSSINYYYLLRDYLGNLVCLFNSSNGIDAEYSYDAWGRRRDKDTWSMMLTNEAGLFAGRGYTGHEHLEQFGLINMNGRLYDPIVARFLSPDNYVQMPDYTQNFNRYSYCLNNPLVYTDPSGEFIWGPIIAMIIQQAYIGGARASTNDNITIMGGVWRGAASGAVGALLAPVGGSGLTFAQNFGLGVAQGAITGGFDAALWGDDIGQSMLWGAGSGAIFATLSSENFSNWTKGKGFYNNETVFSKFKSGEYAIPKGSTWQQEALNHFGFGGTYDPNAPLFQKYGPQPGITDPTTGDVFYHDFTFQDNFDRFAFTADHEMAHRRNVLSGKYEGVKIDFQVAANEEWGTYLYNYKNQGLYRNHRVDLISRINYYGIQTGVYDMIITPTSSYTTEFSKKWWHFLYKIPRRW